MSLLGQKMKSFGVSISNPTMRNIMVISMAEKEIIFTYYIIIKQVDILLKQS